MYNIWINSHFKFNAHNYENCPNKCLSIMTGINTKVYDLSMYLEFTRDDKNLGNPVVHIKLKLSLCQVWYVALFLNNLPDKSSSLPDH